MFAYGTYKDSERKIPKTFFIDFFLNLLYVFPASQNAVIPPTRSLKHNS